MCGTCLPDLVIYSFTHACLPALLMPAQLRRKSNGLQEWQLLRLCSDTGITSSRRMLQGSLQVMRKKASADRVQSKVWEGRAGGGLYQEGRSRVGARNQKSFPPPVRVMRRAPCTVCPIALPPSLPLYPHLQFKNKKKYFTLSS